MVTVCFKMRENILYVKKTFEKEKHPNLIVK